MPSPAATTAPESRRDRRFTTTAGLGGSKLRRPSAQAFRDSANGHGVVVFESKEQAQQMAGMVTSLASYPGPG